MATSARTGRAPAAVRALLVLSLVGAVLVAAPTAGAGGGPAGLPAVAGDGAARTAAPLPTADFVPYVGSWSVGCTRGNPSPNGVCSHHHSYSGAVDLHMPVGLTIRAAGPGTVVFVNDTCAVGDAGCQGGAGRWVGVEHPDGKVSRYLHLQSASVTVGQAVQRGTPLGTSGFTGNSFVEHLHYDEQRPLYTRSEIGPMYACHGSRLVTYPQVLGHAHWDAVPYGSVVRNDGYGCVGSLFVDVPTSHPFHPDIEWMVTSGVTEGFADGTFKPTAPVTRQAIAAWFHRLAGSPSPAAPQPLVDVPSGHRFEEEIWWMVGTGRARGYPDGTFRPVLCVSRQAVAAFLHREAGAPSAQTNPVFSDVPPEHPFALAIGWMVQEGITEGYADGRFQPGECATRQSAAAFLHRAQA